MKMHRFGIAFILVLLATGTGVRCGFDVGLCGCYICGDGNQRADRFHDENVIAGVLGAPSLQYVF